MFQDSTGSSNKKVVVKTSEEEFVPKHYSIAYESKILKKYDLHLDATIKWILRSIKNGKGGSAAYYGIWGYWSKPYPETTGYIIPTLIRYAKKRNSDEIISRAVELGNWLLSIQNKEGFWNGGVHKKDKTDNPSVFNTAQIIKGMCALYLETGDAVWLNSAYNSALWLSNNVDDNGMWQIGNYRKDFNPSYYAQVAWPMLELWHLTKEDIIKDKAEQVLLRIMNKMQDNGVIKDWSFNPTTPAFTHTIAYTIRSFQESARLLQEYDQFEKPLRKVLDFFVQRAEANRGKLPGAYDENLVSQKRYSCLTGNVQLAICIMNYYERTKDLRLINAAAKLVDYVCSTQNINSVFADLKGGVAGSKPLWGKYMMFRFPNWAAKYHADALMKLTAILKKEGL